MMIMTRKNNFRLIILGGISIGLIVAGTLAGVAGPVAEVQANGLPPRGQPPPSDSPDQPQPQKTDKQSDSGPLGTHIELQTQPAAAGLWSVIQWQDHQGDWHNVEGWRGTVNERGAQRWWVDQKDFATGPFRWAVMFGENGAVISTSQVFDLPAGADQTLLVVVPIDY
jgi:hypothetical protein